jgi:peptide methionine sulfoxide reductase MsrA
LLGPNRTRRSRGCRFRSEGLVLWDTAEVLLGDPAEQLAAADASKSAYGRAIGAKGYGVITTEGATAGPLYLAEHQQYLAKVPHGYCSLSGTGVACPKPAGESAQE